MELRRRGVKDLPSAMAAADGLVDFRISQPVEGTEGTSKPKSKGREPAAQKKSKGRENGQSVGKASAQEKGKISTFSGCFICSGPHRAKDCSKKERLNAVVEEGGRGDEASPSRVNPLQLVNAMRAERSIPSGLMYMKVRLGGKEMLAMADTGATHNFMTERTAHELGLKVTKSSSKIKAVNSVARDVAGIAAGVQVSLGSWTGVLSFTIVTLDDFDIILGIEFFVQAKAALLPHLGGFMLLHEEYPCFISSVANPPARNGGTSGAMLSALQVKHGLRRGEAAFLVSLVERKEGVMAEVPNEVADPLQKYADLMPAELPKELPPRRTTDHKIKLVPGVKAPAQAPYCMSPLELGDLRKQFTELLDAGMIQPSKAPYGAPVLFQRRKDS
ncbi:uncharacterized protein [Elaeis guineensis]|uniref:uncharacterized protein n=1 Tax=Elaeis guineensis var. tenera TaxID=51953 RepID=UPI003C6D401A